jgi:hypothetical protein
MMDAPLQPLAAILSGYAAAHQGKVSRQLVEEGIAPPTGAGALIYFERDVMGLIHCFTELDGSDDPRVHEHSKEEARGWFRSSHTFSTFIFEMFRDFVATGDGPMSFRDRDWEIGESLPVAKRARRTATRPRSVPAAPASSGVDGVDLNEARALFGKAFIGPERVAETLGWKGSVPAISFSRDELVRAQGLGQQLILFVESAGATAITMRWLNALLERKASGSYVVCEPSPRSVRQAFYDDHVPRGGWALVTPGLVPETAGKDFIGQTQALADYLRNAVFAGSSLPERHRAALDEFERQLPEIRKLCDVPIWQDLEPATRLEALLVNQLARERPVEVLYRYAVSRLRSNQLFVTNTRLTANGGYFFVSLFSQRQGLSIHGQNMRSTSSTAGSSFARWSDAEG